MIRALEWLLGLERIRLAEDAPLTVRFATPPEAWIQFLGMALAIAAVVFVYRREHLPARWRAVLIGLRLGVVALVLGMLARPLIILKRVAIDPSVVAVLIDRSSSMATVDETRGPSASGPTPAGGRRWDNGLTALNGASGLLPRLAETHRVDVWSFARTARHVGVLDRPGDAGALSRLLAAREPEGTRTDIIGAVATVLNQLQGRRLAGLIVVSDGRQNAPPHLESVVSLARARGVPLHMLAVGSTRPRRDIAIGAVWADEHVLLNDPVTVRVRLDATGYAEAVEVHVRLRDLATDQVVASKTHRVGGESDSVDLEFQYRPARGGRRGLRVTVAPRDDEQETSNNGADIVVTVHDEKIGLLYVEGRARFEYRYLKNLIIREPTIESSCLLTDADPGFPQEGTRPIRRFPESIEELLQYDAVILGDVDPRDPWMDSAQMAILDDFVSIHGGGLGLIAGERAMPHALAGTPLARLLPVRPDPQFYGRYEDVILESFSPSLTAEGRDSPLLRMDTSAADPGSVIRELPGWFWYAQVLGPKPGASVLANHPAAQTATGEPMPLVVVGRYGAGRTLYVGSDDVWRWRRYTGETYYEHFWLQAIRTLARGRRLGGAQRWRLETDRRNYEFGEPVRVRLHAGESNNVDVVDRVVVDALDARGGLVDRVTLTRAGPRSRSLTGTFVPRRRGTYVLSVSEPRSLKRAEIAERSVTVAPGDPERRRLEADHEFLRMVAGRTRGRVHVLPDDIGRLVDAIPDKSVQVPDDIQEPLWDTRLVLMAFVLLIVVEWVIRKVHGLA